MTLNSLSDIFLINHKCMQVELVGLDQSLPGKWLKFSDAVIVDWQLYSLPVLEQNVYVANKLKQMICARNYGSCQIFVMDMFY